MIWYSNNMMVGAEIIIISQDDQCYGACMVCWSAESQSHMHVAFLHCYGSPAQIILTDDYFVMSIAVDHRGRSGGPSELHTSPGSLAPR